jgi:hypothetical protein
MEIGPISAIRAATMIKPSLAAPDLSRVFEVEYLGHSADDEYTPGNGKATRGLEDEEENLDEAAESGARQLPPPMGKVSFFA